MTDTTKMSCEQLRQHFVENAIPARESFAALIDSRLSLLEDGVGSTPAALTVERALFASSALEVTGAVTASGLVRARDGLRVSGGTMAVGELRATGRVTATAGLTVTGGAAGDRSMEVHPSLTVHGTVAPKELTLGSLSVSRISGSLDAGTDSATTIPTCGAILAHLQTGTYGSPQTDITGDAITPGGPLIAGAGLTVTSGQTLYVGQITPSATAEHADLVIRASGRGRVVIDRAYSYLWNPSTIRAWKDPCGIVHLSGKLDGLEGFPYPDGPPIKIDRCPEGCIPDRDAHFAVVAGPSRSSAGRVHVGADGWIRVSPAVALPLYLDGITYEAVDHLKYLHLVLDGNTRSVVDSDSPTVKGTPAFATNDALFGACADFTGGWKLSVESAGPSGRSVQKLALATWVKLNDDRSVFDRSRLPFYQTWWGSFEAEKTCTRFEGVKGPPLNAAEWTHVAITYSDREGPQMTPQLRLYMNGVVVDSSSRRQGLSKNSNPNAVDIGAFPGRMAHVRYCEWLSDAQVMKLYRSHE